MSSSASTISNEQRQRQQGLLLLLLLFLTIGIALWINSSQSKSGSVPLITTSPSAPEVEQAPESEVVKQPVAVVSATPPKAIRPAIKESAIIPRLRLQIAVYSSDGKQMITSFFPGEKTIQIKHPARLKLNLLNDSGKARRANLFIALNQDKLTSQSLPLSWEPVAGLNSLKWRIPGGKDGSEQLITQQLYLDARPPTIQAKIIGSPTTADGSIAPTARLQLSAADEAGGGLKDLLWKKVGESKWQSYRQPLELNQLHTAKKCEVEVQALDLAGNQSIERYHYQIDDTPPALPLFAGKHRSGPNFLLIPTEGITLTSIEPGTTVSYRFGQESFKKYQSGERLYRPDDLTSTFTLKAEDEVGNSNQKSYQLVTDKTPPHTRLLINGQEVGSGR